MDPRGHGGYAESEGVSSQENVNPHSNFPCRPAHRSRQSSYRSKICPPEERAGKHVQFGHFEGKSMAGPLEKQKSFYLVMTGAPCYRQESFAVKGLFALACRSFLETLSPFVVPDSAWFGGAGSVRGLVRQYESQRDLTVSEVVSSVLVCGSQAYQNKHFVCSFKLSQQISIQKTWLPFKHRVRFVLALITVCLTIFASFILVEYKKLFRTLSTDLMFGKL